MIKTIFKLALLLNILGHASVLANPSANFLCVTLQTVDADICAINIREDSANWFKINHDEMYHDKLEPPQSMSYVSDVKVSPSEQFLAILSVGEGHPILDIISVKALLNNQEEPLFSLNPYPGWISAENWQGEKLIITSDRLLSENNQDLYQGEKFLLDAKSFKISPLSPNVKQPIQYYLYLLATTHDKWQTEEIIQTLVSLNAVEAIPTLKQFLQQPRMIEFKPQLEKAIQHLSID